MKLHRTIGTALLVCLAGGSGATDTQAIKSALETKMPGVRVRTVTKAPYADLYEVVANGFNVFYTDEKGEVAFVGKVVDLRTRADLTERRVEQLMTIDFSRLPLDKAIRRVKGNGSRRLALFSDPDCPYCRELEKELESVTDVTTYTFLLPLTSIHPDAMRKAQLIWCAADRAKAYDELMLKAKEPAGDGKCETPIDDIVALARELWIEGTPGMVFGSGKLVPGALKRHQIEALLDGAPKRQNDFRR